MGARGPQPTPPASVLFLVTIAVAVAVVVPMMVPIMPLGAPIVVVRVVAPVNLLDRSVGRRRGRFDRRTVRGKNGGRSRFCLNCESKQAANSHSRKETHSGSLSKWKPECRLGVWPESLQSAAKTWPADRLWSQNAARSAGQCATHSLPGPWRGARAIGEDKQASWTRE